MTSGQQNRHYAPPTRLEKRGSIWFKREQNRDIPVTPAELRRIMFPDLEGMTEQDLLRTLVKKYRWTWVGKETLRRYNPFRVDIREILEGADAA